MKGVSDVIAMLLMLVITIGLVGLAYSYISGVFVTRTAVVLSVDQATNCLGNTVNVFVRNDGTQTSGAVSVVVYNATMITGTCTIPSITAGNVSSCSTTKVGGPGYYRIVVSTTGSSASGQVYCVS
ncbi:MAG: hypothetical protein N3D78_01500 [Candidatus Aenigmarchaeota archaeon]|nr:hypothetical protein [Candidatus Aenigmarchaeota archaeon]